MRLDPAEVREELAPRVFTLEQVAQAVDIAITEIEVCAPDGDFYARGDDWQKRTLYLIDPYSFMRALREM